MTDALTFSSTTPRLGLPMLYAGQAQKEAFVNEAHSLIDALLHCSVAGAQGSAPASPSEGDNWIISTGASGDWAGQDGMIAMRQSGNWLFAPPRDGMMVFNRATSQFMRYQSGWHCASAVAPVTGGTVVDVEARAAFAALLTALKAAGILPA